MCCAALDIAVTAIHMSRAAGKLLLLAQLVSRMPKRESAATAPALPMGWPAVGSFTCSEDLQRADQ
jgi:hypothetical protein